MSLNTIQMKMNLYHLKTGLVNRLLQYNVLYEGCSNIFDKVKVLFFVLEIFYINMWQQPHI